LEPAKECVITHLPNELALKMDVAKQPADTLLFWFMTSEQVEGREGRAEGFVWTRLERHSSQEGLSRDALSRKEKSLSLVV